MKKPFLLLLAVMCFPSGGVANEFHPQFRLLDEHGELVLLSGKPLSTMQTCGECHDVGFIHQSSDHADAGASQINRAESRHEWAFGPGYFGAWDPLEYDQAVAADGSLDVDAWLRRYGPRHVGGGPVADSVEMNCLLCHGDVSDGKARGEALSMGEFAWANSAALSSHDIATRIDGEWRWNPWAFLANGHLAEGLMAIRKPRDENCAQCHGQATSRLNEPLTIDPDTSLRSMTNRTGQIISPQKIRNSGLNVANKESLNHAFDVHADRVVGCVNCHYSLNNPVYFQQRQESLPAHLAFDPRRLSSADYLERPSHQFAKGSSMQGLAATRSENSLRRCESCHDAARVHDWLPFKERHFASLACESCHIPRIYGPALQALDWTLVDANGEPLRQYRDVDGDPATADSLIQGYRPVMLARENVGGERKLAPYNLVSTWYWLAGDPRRPVTREQLVNALYEDGELRPALVQVLDSDGSGQVDASEFRLTTDSAIETVRRLLSQAGLQQIELAAETLPYPISHNVVNGRWAGRECRSCHGGDSALAAEFVLSDYLPGGLLPTLSHLSGVGSGGQIQTAVNGGAGFLPRTSAEGYYVIGLDNVALVDLAGLVMFFGVLLGVSGHAMARYIAHRRRPRVEHSTHPVKLYDAYDRIWHWLQAGAILILIFTGLVIHKPHLFGMFSFSYMVQVHNVLGFILLINAALALFYTLASGTIKRFLPEPKDFFARSFEQAMYYSKGIFAGAPHPLEKSMENRLNPLQQITYLAILNILLPAQVITGVLIWGMQEWPALATALGGLPMLAPIHTFVAWAFCAFIVMHVYLTTTGETPTAGIRSMVSGWENVEDH